MTCKDCVHYDVCPMAFASCDTDYYCCEHFKDKSKFIELPCKVGDIVYKIEFGLIHATGGIIIPCRVICIDVSKDEIIVIVNPDKHGNMTYGINDYSFGKTTFLTKEEAEAKLKEMEREKNESL